MNGIMMYRGFTVSRSQDNKKLHTVNCTLGSLTTRSQYVACREHLVEMVRFRGPEALCAKFFRYQGCWPAWNLAPISSSPKLYSSSYVCHIFFRIFPPGYLFCRFSSLSSAHDGSILQVNMTHPEICALLVDSLNVVFSLHNNIIIEVSCTVTSLTTHSSCAPTGRRHVWVVKRDDAEND